MKAILIPQAHPTQINTEVRKAEKKRHTKNTAIAAGGALASTAGLAVLADKLTKSQSQTAQSVKNAANSVKSAVSGTAKNVGNRIGTIAGRVKKSVVSRLPEKSRILGSESTIRNKVAGFTGKVVKSVAQMPVKAVKSTYKAAANMNKGVAVAAGTAAALITGTALYRAGQIKGEDKSVKKFNEASDKFASEVNEKMEIVKAFLHIGDDDKKAEEQK